jgi:hypothetical protein
MENAGPIFISIPVCVPTKDRGNAKLTNANHQNQLNLIGWQNKIPEAAKRKTGRRITRSVSITCQIFHHWWDTHSKTRL